MTAHSHPFTRPAICTPEQKPLMGEVGDLHRVYVLIDAHWIGREQYLSVGAETVAASPGALLVLRRACTLQETGVLRWPHGTPEGDEELAKLREVDGATLRKLADAGGRMWVARARLFDEINQIGKSDGEGEGRLLARPRTKRFWPRQRRS